MINVNTGCIFCSEILVTFEEGVEEGKMCRKVQSFPVTAGDTLLVTRITYICICT